MATAVFRAAVSAIPVAAGAAAAAGVSVGAGVAAAAAGTNAAAAAAGTNAAAAAFRPGVTGASLLTPDSAALGVLGSEPQASSTSASRFTSPKLYREAQGTAWVEQCRGKGTEISAEYKFSVDNM